MKNLNHFIFKFSIYFFPVLVILIVNGFAANGYTDWFYLNFTSPRQNSLILGTSKSAQGIQPSIIDSLIIDGYCNHIQNFSFTVSHSPYGPVYFNAIKKKLRNEKLNCNGLFILSVDPWSISSVIDKPNDSINFRENTLSLATTNWINFSPNYNYLLNSYEKPYLNVLIDRILGKKSPLFLHYDGWTEITVPMDSVSISSRITKRINEYKSKNLPVYKFSELRYEYLKKIINYLKHKGNIFLVRIPVHGRMLEVEDTLMPDFNNKMKLLSEECNVPYLNYTNNWDLYIYTDGIHLYKSSGKEFSKELVQDINHILLKRKIIY